MIKIEKKSGYCKAKYSDGSKLIISYANAEELINKGQAEWA